MDDADKALLCFSSIHLDCTKEGVTHHHTQAAFSAEMTQVRAALWKFGAL